MMCKEFTIEELTNSIKYGTMPKKERIKDDGKYNIWSGYRIVGKYDECNIKKNQVIVVARGVGGTGDVKISTEDCYLTNLSIALDLNDDIVIPKYLYYYFQIKNLRYLDSGSAQSQITINDLKKVSVSVPNIRIQEKLIRILELFDRKIELNNQINNNLSEHLQLIFNEWFCKYNCDNLPNEWKIKKIKDIATFSQGVQVPIENQKDIQEDGYTRFIRIVDITQNNKKDIRYIKDTKRGKVVENEIFMIRYGTPGILSRNYNGIIANNLFKITPKSDEVTSNYLYSLLNTNYIQDYVKGNATSSTMPAINFSTLNDREIIIPTKDELKKFDEISEIIRLKQLSIINENNTLEQLRDTLLPKLMNGEIDLENVEI